MPRRGRNQNFGGFSSQDVKGDHWLIDDITGFKIKASDVVHGEGIEQGLLMHRDNFSPIQPQLHIRPRHDDETVSNVRERQIDNFLDTDEDTF